MSRWHLHTHRLGSNTSLHIMPAHPPLRATTFCTWLAVALLCAGHPVAIVGAVAQVSNHGVSASGHAVPFVDEAGQELERDASRLENLDEDQPDSQYAFAILHAPFGLQRPCTPSERFLRGHHPIGPAECTAVVGARAPPRV